MVHSSTKAIKKERVRNVWYIYIYILWKYNKVCVYVTLKKNQICLKLIAFSKFIEYVILSACHTLQFENLSFNISVYREQGAFRHPPQFV